MAQLNIGDFKWELPFEEIECDVADILDNTALQEIVQDFYNLTKMGISILDLDGNTLVKAGWQDACVLFHRKHPESCRNCIESDTILSQGVKPGEFKLYKCKNGMWDIVTPVHVCGKHLANIYFGQFFFKDEEPDIDFFESQADKYGYNKEQYISAIEDVPRYSRDEVARVMSFYQHLARHISHLSHQNLLLTHNLQLKDEIFRSNKIQALMLEQIHDRIVISDTEGNILYTNAAIQEATGFTKTELSQMNVRDFASSPVSDATQQAIIKDTLESGSWNGLAENISKSGEESYVDIRTFRIDDEKGVPLALCGIASDVTEKHLYLNMLKRLNSANHLLVELSRKFLRSQPKSIDSVIDSCLSDLGDFLHLDRACLFVIDADQKLFSNSHEWCREGVESQQDKLQNKDLSSAPAFMQEIMNHRMICLDDLQRSHPKWSRERKLLKLKSIKALLVAPLVLDELLLGFIGFDMMQQARIWDEVDFMVIQVVADLLAATFGRQDSAFIMPGTSSTRIL